MTYKELNERIISILMIVCIAISLCGCAKCISVETSEVQVTIKDANYKPARSTVTYNPAFKMPIVQSVPAKYEITVEYDGVEYYFTDKDIYEQYSEKMGENAIGILETRKYDDGTIKNRIIEIK